MELPDSLTSQVKAGDTVLAFIPAKGGWVALTEERLIYQARTYYLDGSGYVSSTTVETANLPLSKISSISTQDIKIKTCIIIRKKVAVLVINMQGGFYRVELGKDSSPARQFIQKFTEMS